LSAWEALVLGVVQGATEFLPVSSSGHLVVGQTLLGVEAPGVSFEIVVHLATLLSVLVVYRERVLRLMAGALRREREAWGYVGLLALATVPAGIVGVLFKDSIEALFDDPRATGIAFMVTGVILWSTRPALARQPDRPPGVRDAVWMGLAQALALVPGISRSGSTVTAGLWSRVDPTEAAAFSFLMSVPAISGAAILQIPDLTTEAGAVGLAALVVGGIAAAVTGVLAIRTFVVLLEKRAFHHFAIYVALLGIGFLAYLGLANG
jgi:undecaprenyl-diphosphatase